MALILLAFLWPSPGLAGPSATFPRSPVSIPATAAEYADQARACLTELAELPLARPLTRDAIVQVLGGITLDVAGELDLVLRALGVPLETGPLSVPVSKILERMGARGLETAPAAALVESLAAGATLDDRHLLERLTLVTMGCHWGLNASVDAADHFLLSVMQLVRFVLKAVRTVEKLTRVMKAVPGVRQALRTVSRALVNRLVKTLRSVTYLATRPIRQPARSRLRAAVAVLTAVYLRWDAIAHGSDPGASATDLAWTVAAWTAKGYLLGSRKVGASVRLQRTLDRAVALARGRDFGGSTAGAIAAAVTTLSGQRPDAILETLARDMTRRMKLAGIERHAGSIAGATSDIALLGTAVDPTGVTKVVAAVGRVLQGGLIMHSLWLSGSMLHRIPREISRMVDPVFHPERLGPVTAAGPGPPPRTSATGKTPEESVALVVPVDRSLDLLAEALTSGTHPARFEAPIKALEQADRELLRRVARIPSLEGQALVESVWKPGASEEALLAHDLESCALLAGCLDSMIDPVAGAKPRQALEALARVRSSVATLGQLNLFMEPSSIRSRSPVPAAPLDPDEGASLVVTGPGAIGSDGDEVTVENVGTATAREVVVEVAGLSTVVVGDMDPGGSVRVAVSVPPGALAEGALLVLAREAGGSEAALTLWLRP